MLIAIDSPAAVAMPCGVRERWLRAMPPSHSSAVGASNEDAAGGSEVLRSHGK